MLNNLSKKHDIKTFSISAENLTGEKGKGGMAIEGNASLAARELGQGWKVNPYLIIKPKEVFAIADVKGQGAIKHIWVTHALNVKNRNIIIRMYWDGAEKPAVECPLGDLFANADEEYRQVSSLAVCNNPNRGMNLYWEMPYKEGFKITIENRGEENLIIYYQIDCEEKQVGDDALYFHAFFHRINPLPYKEPYTIVEGIKGDGQYVGTYLYWGVNNNGWWGEGEIKFYIDGDKDFPTICGTGTEDYFCGAFNFDVGGKYCDFTTPYSGMSVGITNEIYASNRRFHLYRWHINDPIYFKKDLKVTIQALGWRSGGRYLPLQDDISSVAYWYSDKKETDLGALQTCNELEII